MQENASAYEVIFDKEPIKYLNKLEKQLKERIFNKIIETKPNPLHFFEKLENRTDYKLRIGNYRAIADIENNKIIITKIGHRKNVYQ